MASIQFKICSYRPKSAGARYLREALEKLLRRPVEQVGPDYCIPSNTWVINWGNGAYHGEREPGAKNTKIINPAHTIVNCINKIDFFRIMDNAEVEIPAWTQRQSRAVDWIQAGHRVYCRQETEGKDGTGIVIAETQGQLVPAHLYTKAESSTAEYRVHVFRSRPIFDLLKYHDSPTAANRMVRTGKNGWQYTRECIMPAPAHIEAVKVAKALGVDFCAVDILWNKPTQKATVLEANSAPELGPWTSAAYARELVALL